ncbi:MAG: hypothetical protein ABSD74_03990 [Rhizomicrobium sp.]
MSAQKRKDDFKKALDGILKEFVDTSGVGKPDFAGAQSGNPLEHNTRRHCIDRILTALGWDLSTGQDLIEEARTKGETTLFLDYLGVHPEARIPAMIVEAKAWALPMVSMSRTGADKHGPQIGAHARDVIALGVMHSRSGGDVETSPVIEIWAKWIAKAREYVANVHAQSGQVVSSFAITSGRWMVIFKDLANTLLSPDPTAPIEIVVFEGSEGQAGLVVNSDEIYESLSREFVIGRVPPYIRPTQITSYANLVGIVKAYRALWVSRSAEGAHFAVRPQIFLYPALVVERSDRVLVTVLDQGSPHILPHRREDLSAHINEVSAASDRLLDTLNATLGGNIVLSDVADFSGFDSVLAKDPAENLGGGGPSDGKGRLLRAFRPKPNEYLLVCGTNSHYLTETPSVEGCAFHSWAVCSDAHENAGTLPILARSVDPASFFMSGEQHHCAHRTVHDRRENRCQIDSFETYLCCRACAFQSYCWTDAELVLLPCQA